MKCAQARKLFGAYWDDDLTQAEREWLETHFVGCASCRVEYEEFSRVLEWTASLPRVEPAPDLVERTLARARRAVRAPDRISSEGAQWVPVTAAAALLLIVAALISPWMGLGPSPRVADHEADQAPVRQPEVVEPTLVSRVDAPPASGAGEEEQTGGAPLSSSLVALPDSLLDHSEDVEFILDPVVLRRGRATMTRQPAEVQGERAVITF